MQHSLAHPSHKPHSKNHKPGSQLLFPSVNPIPILGRAVRPTNAAVTPSSPILWRKDFTLLRLRTFIFLAPVCLVLSEAGERLRTDTASRSTLTEFTPQRTSQRTEHVSVAFSRVFTLLYARSCSYFSSMAFLVSLLFIFVPLFLFCPRSQLTKLSLSMISQLYCSSLSLVYEYYLAFSSLSSYSTAWISLTNVSLFFAVAFFFLPEHLLPTFDFELLCDKKPWVPQSLLHFTFSIRNKNMFFCIFSLNSSVSIVGSCPSSSFPIMQRTFYV